MAFKMKGSSLYGKLNLNKGGQANGPDGRAKSSAFQKDVKGGVTPTVTVSGGDKTERHADKFDRVKSTKGSDDTKTAKLAAEYGGTWSRKGTTFVNQDGKNAKQVAVAQGQKKSQEKRDYKAENTTKKPGAPAIWPFKKKIKGTNTELVKVKNKQTQRGKKIRTTPEWKKKLSRAFDKTTKKISDYIQEPGEKGNRPGFD